MSTVTVTTTLGEVKLTMNGCVSLHNIWATLNDAPLMSWMPEDKSAVDVGELLSSVNTRIYICDVAGEGCLSKSDWKAIKAAIDKLVDGEYRFVNAVDLW